MAQITHKSRQGLTTSRSFIAPTGNYDAAEPLYKRALAVSEKAFSPDHPDVAAALNNLALLYHIQGKYDAAGPLYKRALAIWERALGPDHAHTKIARNNLAALPRKAAAKTSRNSPCPCGSGKKYKHCHGAFA